MTGPYHVPVLLEEVLRFLPADPNGVCVDGTLGGGGHARALAERLGAGGVLLGLDRDPAALAACRDLEAAHPGRVTLEQASFDELPHVLRRRRLGPVSGLLLDLGVSSHQLDEGARGFSFLRDGPLDMRMGPGAESSAEALVNGATAEELKRIFREFGEEPQAGRVARAIVAARERRPLRTTGDLARTVEKALGRRGGKHPATRVFQALRIAVNREMEALDGLLVSLPGLLSPGGRVVVISYHSLEDRRVKQAFRSAEPHCVCPPRIPLCTCGEPGWLRVLTPRAVKPGMEELERNPRARSAHLRAAERLPDGAPFSASQGGQP
ncbi:MAG: 16S rRNA (cytosine(1402)-N(4))-methyltransferase RsmH [Deltaproteobacteria bacterium]|nr:16S rRNA (cytosine(1402)-N(4))-methyltransferase RsmH [Deltaproteobacteria bacterium]